MNTKIDQKRPPKWHQNRSQHDTKKILKTSSKQTPSRFFKTWKFWKIWNVLKRIYCFFHFSEFFKTWKKWVFQVPFWYRFWCHFWTGFRIILGLVSEVVLSSISVSFRLSFRCSFCVNVASIFRVNQTPLHPLTPSHSTAAPYPAHA